MAAKLVWPVRVSEELGAAIDYAAEQAGVKRSTWMVKALESALAGETPRPSPAGREAKSEAVKGPGRPAAASRQGASSQRAPTRTSDPSAVPGVLTARQLLGARQAKLNAAKDRA